MEILLKDGVKYIEHSFELESQFEKVILEQWKYIFGENAILFDKQKIKTETGIGTIPDAFVILPATKQWFIIEVELAVHSVYQHIIPQITKFKNAISNNQNRKALAKYFDKVIENDLHKLANWFSATGDKNVFRLLVDILDSEPQLLIIIDAKNAELELASKNLPFETKINVFKIFCRENVGLGDNIFQFHSYENILRNSTVSVVKVQTEKAIDSSSSLSRKAPSPSAIDWVKKIPELQNIQGLKNWKDICDHFKLKVHQNSARRVLKSWVEKSRPQWTSVPEA